MSNRDEFSPKTKNAVAARAGWRCSMEGCERSTVGPSDESSEAVTMIGQAAHISGASSGPGSRRYDPSITQQQRKNINNAIWLCAVHAVAIDRDEVKYTVPVLQRMKLVREAAQDRELLTGVVSDQGTGLLAVGPEVICMGDIESVYADRWILRLRHFVAGDIHRLISFIDEFPKTTTQDRYVLSNELGDGRVLSDAPSFRREPDGYILTCPVEPGCPRIDAQNLGTSFALHPVTHDWYADERGNLARVAGLEALPQYVRSALSMQRGENVFAPDSGMRFFEYFQEYRGSIWLNRFLTLDVVRQASIPVPNVASDGQHTPLQCVTRVRSFEFLSETPEDHRLPVRVDFEIRGVGRWQHEFSVYMPTEEQIVKGGVKPGQCGGVKVGH